MTRRNFFRTFGGFIAAVAVAQNVVKDLAVKVVEKSKTVLVPNPAWVNAKYEVAFISAFRPYDKNEVIPIVFKRSKGKTSIPLKENESILHDQYPIRFNGNEELKDLGDKLIQPFCEWKQV